VVRDRSAEGHEVPRRGSSARTRVCARRAPRMCCFHHYMARSTVRSVPGAFQGRHRRRVQRDRQRGPGARSEIRTTPASSRSGCATARRTGSFSTAARRSRRTDVLSLARQPAHVPRPASERGRSIPAFEDEVRRFKFRGSSGKVNLAIDRLPDFTALPGTGEHLGARSRSARASRTWRRPTTTRSTAASAASRTST
jgi:hypothetical protein